MPPVTGVSTWGVTVSQSNAATPEPATAGLAILFGAQSAINMAVNLALIPAKGMTLPFISYGGSSMISLAYGMGMLLAFTRERPRTVLLPSPYAAPIMAEGAVKAAGSAA